MQDSTDTRITYRAILERAEQCARDAMPDFPKQDSLESWEAYVAEIESIDAFEVAHESADWDWTIYYRRAMELCQAVPNSVLDEAESEYNDMGGYGDIDVRLYDLASHLAHIIVTREIVDAIEQVREELLEVANDKLDKLESESV